MTQQQLNELRSDIKVFVADRKIDEDLGRSVRFAYDRNVLEQVVPNFGEIGVAKSAPSTSKSSRDRVSSSASELSTAASTATTASLLHSVSKTEESQPHVAEDQPHLTLDMHSKNEAPVSNSDVLPPPTPDWADSVDSPPALETRASWASDIPLVPSSHIEEYTFHEAAVSEPDNVARRENQSRYGDGRNSRSTAGQNQATMPPLSHYPTSRSKHSRQPVDRRFSQENHDFRRDRGEKSNFVNTNDASGDGYLNFSKNRYRGGGGYNNGGYRKSGRGGGYRNGPGDRYYQHQVNGDGYYRPYRAFDMGPSRPQRNRPKSFRDQGHDHRQNWDSKPNNIKPAASDEIKSSSNQPPNSDLSF